ncbi:MAG TPA: GDP-L-fucose synthase [Candidatus Kapabacteria bacterium]|nr:GDP-L-fucose synthase [Candidatus Kapabacteria bacterium]
MKKNSKIFIAGHKGLVGSVIYKNLLQQGFENIIVAEKSSLDLRNQAQINNFFAIHKPEFVILAAGKVGGIIANSTYKAEFIYDNLMIAANIINAAKEYGIKKLLNLGSSCIFPKQATIPIKEEYLLTGALEATNEPYAIAKIAAIKLCRYYNEQYGTDFISVMPNNLYGINDNYNFETSHVLPALIRKNIIAKALSENNFDLILKDSKLHKIGFGLDDNNNNNIDLILNKYSQLGITSNEITLWGTGNVYREFLFNEDLAEACIFLMQNYSANEIGEFINVGYGTDITIKEVTNIIRDIVGYNGSIKFDSSKPDGTYRKLMDTSRINNLGWKPNTNLETGIKIVVDGYYNKLKEL